MNRVADEARRGVPDTAAVLDRRSLLAGAAATAAGMIVSMAAPDTAMASAGDFVKVGELAENSGAFPALWAKTTGVECVRAETTALGHSGVVGTGSLGTGVSGFGVRGVHGVGSSGDGVHGETGAATKSGVYAVHTGTAGYALFARASSGTAIRAEGVASFMRSGSTKVRQRRSSVTITVPGVPLTADSKFLVTLQRHPGQGVYLLYSAKASANTFKVYFNKKTSRPCYVAWMVLD
jgi:hypothetical protein